MPIREMMVFCTLFDSNYLDRGLALYWSMRKHISVFKLYICAFDSACFKILSDMELENVVLLSVEDIMTSLLKEKQKERSRAEFCWTCTPLVIEYVLLKYGEKACTYIDADIYFFSSPLCIVQEVIDSGCSVGLVIHRFERNSEYGGRIFSVGKYCIQFNTFLNDEAGIRVLSDWKQNCLEWCYARYEDGKFGDQKYPDKWRQKYSGVHESQNTGAGVAPWNLHLYSYYRRDRENIWLQYQGVPFQLIFYHFEGFKDLSNGKMYLNIWRPSERGMSRKIHILYGEYLKVMALVRNYLTEEYGVTFEQMYADESVLVGKSQSLKRFWNEEGLIDGGKKWAAYWTNNICFAKCLMKGNGIICFCKKKSKK